MVDILPEGKVQITVSSELKDKIAGVDYTSQGLSVWLTRVVDSKNQEQMYTVAQDVVDLITQRYAEKLAKDLEVQKEKYEQSLQDMKDTRNPQIDQIRIDLSGEYDEKLKLAKQEILKLRKLLKDNG
jgi:hypothetical protein